jgi:hypothetical protein
MIPHYLDNWLTDGSKAVRPADRLRPTPQKHYLSASGSQKVTGSRPVGGE